MLAGTQEHCIPCIGICMYHFGFIGVRLLHPIVSITLPLFSTFAPRFTGVRSGISFFNGILVSLAEVGFSLIGNSS